MVDTIIVEKGCWKCECATIIFSLLSKCYANLYLSSP